METSLPLSAFDCFWKHCGYTKIASECKTNCGCYPKDVRVKTEMTLLPRFVSISILLLFSSVSCGGESFLYPKVQETFDFLAPCCKKSLCQARLVVVIGLNRPGDKINGEMPLRLHFLHADQSRRHRRTYSFLPTAKQFAFFILPPQLSERALSLKNWGLLSGYFRKSQLY